VKLITVYIASPYTIGDVGANVHLSFVAADALAHYGYAPFPPLFSHFWHLMFPHEYEFWVNLDNEWVKRCDVMLRLPGESKGADAEVALARSLGVPVYFSIRSLIENVPPDYVKDSTDGTCN
jgi:hypothetical protein